MPLLANQQDKCFGSRFRKRPLTLACNPTRACQVAGHLAAMHNVPVEHVRAVALGAAHPFRAQIESAVRRGTLEAPPIPSHSPSFTL